MGRTFSYIPMFFLLCVISDAMDGGGWNGFASEPQRSDLAQRPNIVYILADDFGYGDLQSSDPTRSKIPTPCLDRLASQGMRFTDAHSGSSVCTPTRYGLLTGRYAWRSRLQRGVLDGTDDPPLIDKSRLTVGSFLKQQGYVTAAIGKWHLGFDSMRPAKGSDDKEASQKGNQGDKGLPVGSRIIEGPITRGFDYFWGCSNARTMSGLIENDGVIESIQPMAMLPRLRDKAVDFIERHAEGAKNGKPFFLYVPLTSPHTPIVPAPDWQGKSSLGPYGDFVMQTDQVVGDILSAIDKKGLKQNTLVIFTSDNGCSPAAKTEALEALGHFASGPFRGYKADIWEGGHRVPFLVRWPGVVSEGTTSHQPICHVDLMATLADLMRRKLPDDSGVDSISFLPALTGTAGSAMRESIVHHSIEGRFAIRTKDWKLALCAGSGGWGSPKEAEAQKRGLPSLQLYDLKEDRAESNNLASQRPEIVAQLMDTLRQYVEDGRSTPGPKQRNDVEIQLDGTSKQKVKK